MIKMIAAESCICQTMVLDFLCSLKAVKNVSPGILIKKSITYLILKEEKERTERKGTRMAENLLTPFSLEVLFGSCPHN